MISNLEEKSSKKLSKELSDIFNNAIHEIEELAEQADDQIVESVHVIRKRLKFLRAFVKLHRNCTEDESYKRINYILRDCGRSLSSCRDAHVRGFLLEEYKHDKAFHKAVKTLSKSNKKITKKLEKELLKNSSTFDDLVSELHQKEVQKYILSLDPNPSCLANGLAVGYEKSYYAFHSELKSHEAELLHEWRKRTKDLQYQLEALLESVPDQITPSYDEVSALCEVLGRINDLFMFLEWIESDEISDVYEDQLEDLKNKLQSELIDLENKADAMGHSLFTRTPDQYRQELRSHLTS